MCSCICPQLVFRGMESTILHSLPGMSWTGPSPKQMQIIPTLVPPQLRSPKTGTTTLTAVHHRTHGCAHLASRVATELGICFHDTCEKQFMNRFFIILPRLHSGSANRKSKFLVIEPLWPNPCSSTSKGKSKLCRESYGYVVLFNTDGAAFAFSYDCRATNRIGMTSTTSSLFISAGCSGGEGQRG